MTPSKARNIDHAEYEIIEFLKDFKDLQPLEDVMAPDKASKDRWDKAAKRLLARLSKRQQSLKAKLPDGHPGRE